MTGVQTCALPISLPEAAAMLRVSPRTIQREIDDGRLSAVKIRRTWRIDPAEFQRYRETLSCPTVAPTRHTGGSAIRTPTASALDALLAPITGKRKPKSKNTGRKPTGNAKAKTANVILGRF